MDQIVNIIQTQMLINFFKWLLKKNIKKKSLKNISRICVKNLNPQKIFWQILEFNIQNMIQTLMNN